MFKKTLSLAVAVLLIASCGNKSGKETMSSSKAENVKFASLIENPGTYVDKNIIVEGKVVHVCPHTGKKMFIVGDNPDVMLYISAGENAPKFPVDLLGSTIAVEGHISRVVTAEKPAGEMINPAIETAACCDSSAKAGEACADSSKTKTAECETESALAKQPVLSDLMMIYNKHTLVK
jgi:hypothetical protein